MASNNDADVLNKGASAIYWVKIFISPFLIGLIIAGVLVVAIPNSIGIVLAIASLVLGAIFGYRMAENARKTIGTVAFSARVMTNTEFTDTTKKTK